MLTTPGIFRRNDILISAGQEGQCGSYEPNLYISSRAQVLPSSWAEMNQAVLLHVQPQYYSPIIHSPLSKFDQLSEVMTRIWRLRTVTQKRSADIPSDSFGSTLSSKSEGFDEGQNEHCRIESKYNDTICQVNWWQCPSSIIGPISVTATHIYKWLK